MTANIVLACPSCALQMTVIPLEEPSQVTCPSCFQRTLLFPGMAPAKPRDVEEFNDLPEPIIVSTQVPGPARSKRFVRRAARRAYAHANGATIRETRKRRLIQTLFGLACLVTIAVVGRWAYTHLEKVPRESWAAIIPGMESPDKLFKEYSNLSDAFLETCDSIEDASSRDRAIPQVQMMAARFRGISSRVEELGPLSKAHFELLDASFQDDVAEDSRRAGEVASVLMAKRMLVSSTFSVALRDATDAIDEAARSIRTTWQKTPDPADQIGHLERSALPENASAFERGQVDASSLNDVN